MALNLSGRSFSRPQENDARKRKKSPRPAGRGLSLCCGLDRVKVLEGDPRNDFLQEGLLLAFVGGELLDGVPAVRAVHTRGNRLSSGGGEAAVDGDLAADLDGRGRRGLRFSSFD